MGLFDFFRKDPTRDWAPYDDARRLQLRVAGRELCGLRLGDWHDRLEALGRPDNRGALKSGAFRYLRWGLEVESVEGRIECFDFRILDLFDRGLTPARVDVDAPSGARITIGTGTTLEQVRAVFREPTEESRDGPDTTWYYFDGEFVLEFGFDGDGIIEHWALYIN